MLVEPLLDEFQRKEIRPYHPLMGSLPRKRKVETVQQLRPSPGCGRHWARSWEPLSPSVCRFRGNDDGRWTVDGGRWAVDDGRWTVDGGRWTVNGGRWTVDGGRWTVDGGRWTRSVPSVQTPKLSPVKLAACQTTDIKVHIVKSRNPGHAILWFQTMT